MTTAPDYILCVPRSYIRLIGDITSAMLLARLAYWTVRCSRPDGWVYKSHADWKEELGLGCYQIDSARRRLSGLGLIEQRCSMAIDSRLPWPLITPGDGPAPRRYGFPSMELRTAHLESWKLLTYTRQARDHSP